MKSASGEWIPVECSQSVLWCGLMATEVSKGEIPVGWHRVMPHRHVDGHSTNNSRQTLWFEVASPTQFPLPIPPKLGLLGGMQIFVKTLTGDSKPYELPAEATVYDLKLRIEETDGIPPPKNRIIFKGKQVLDEDSFGKLGVQAGDTFYLVLALRGGTGMGPQT
eukprot:TRINITY_DN67036_c0_g1_i2.p1 TRINITY_DN67036_c0_g1~~TRINITY_DN67036_c0_g1_i2.p1  ORF type:complete len:164 (+),score=15.85 TRINITY_DN67036_c0_g1_i2:415-906(+)